YEGARSTDDTEFAMLTAQTLIDCAGDLTTEKLLASWHKYIISEGGVAERGGKPLYGAVANLERGARPPLSGKDNVQNNDDGAAMRIAPIGIICPGDPARAAQMAQIESEISHAADGIWAAQAVAASIAVAMDGASVSDVIQAGLDVIPEDSWLYRAMMRAFAICEEAGSIEGAWEGLHTQLWTPVHSMAAEAIPQAYSIFKLTEGDFRRGMFWAGNFGRDADTIGAVVGAMSGAIHGLQVIPPDWVEKVRRPAGVCLRFANRMDIVETAQQLTDLYLKKNGSGGA
ncbi:MAG: ADP-ribosylglycohydrolase family protein, partial [Anaerolineae bacterium]|nr:ADP-ribosylglycohydrolase family protein [Anaerolineae bacterium]